jgi:hypothetical protein
LWETSATGILTIHQYWSGELKTEYHPKWGDVTAYGRVRDMSQLNFFAPGMSGDPDNRAKFALRDGVLGATVTRKLTEWLEVSGRVEEVFPSAGPGESTRYPSIEHVFSDREAPGLGEQLRFGRYYAAFDALIPAGVGQAFVQDGRYRVAYGMYQDQKFDAFTFRVLDLEAQQRFAVVGPHRRLTLHAWVSTTDTGGSNRVPFYFQRTLGSKGYLRSVDEDIIGTDGTTATLRGFENFRYRDNHLLLLQAEYRIPIWGPVDATVFVDAGKVTHRRADVFQLSNLAHDYGVSFSVMRAGSGLARLDVARSREGTNVLFTFGGEVF